MAEGFGRESALELLQEWTKGESLRKHGMAVSVCTEAYGRMEAARLGLVGAPAEAFDAGFVHKTRRLLLNTSSPLRGED